MLNLEQGSRHQADGRDCILTTSDGASHAVFGPYARFEPGDYVATFNLAVPRPSDDNPDLLCAILDVAADRGVRVLASDLLFLGQLTETLQPFRLHFTLAEPAEVEFRVRAGGKVPVVIADDAAARPHDGTPPPPVGSDCLLARDTPQEIVDLFIAGRMPERAGRGFRFTADGVVFGGEQRDDINFVHEVFSQKAYNLLADRDQCVIDIGMNVGLSSLVFAARRQVKEVHSFEPFESTYRRALANIALNPALGAKIAHHNVGLSDRDETATIRVPDTEDSGSRSTYDVEGGTPVALALRDAATTLRPIIAAARRRKRFVLAKIDCEGSEFPIFASLAQGGLLAQIDAFMVEWHRFVPGKDVTDLTVPLLAAGFAVIDLSPPTGNGFFYAVKHPYGPRATVWRRLRRGWRRRLRRTQVPAVSAGAP